VPFLGRSAGHRNSCLYSDVWRMIPLTHGRDAPSWEGEVHEVHVCTRSLLCAALLGLCSWHVPDSLSLWTSSKPSEGDLSKLETPSVDKLGRPLSGQRRQRMPVSPMKKRGCLLGYSGD